MEIYIKLDPRLLPAALFLAAHLFTSGLPFGI